MKNEYLFSMALDEIRGRKRSSFLIFFVLFLSFTCAMISLSLTESMDKTNEECRYDTYGIWEGAVLNANERELDFLGRHLLFKKEEWRNAMEKLRETVG